MAAPTAPTLTTIVTEALKKGGYIPPTSAQITRASDYWMEEIKHDIWTACKKLTFLQTASYAVTTKGLNRYSNPTDFSSYLSVNLMDGAHTGTATGGASGSVTLAANEDVDGEFILGKFILITSGTGLNSCSQCTAYSTSTKVATVSPNFSTAPASGSGYMIVDTYFPLKEKPVWEMDMASNPTIKDRPSHFLPVGDSDYGEYLLYPTPDDTYGLQIRYYANLLTLDLAGTLMATLYNRWRSLFVQGVYAKALEDMDDNRADLELGRYRAMLSAVAMRETYGMDLSNMSIRVADY